MRRCSCSPKKKCCVPRTDTHSRRHPRSAGLTVKQHVWPPSRSPPFTFSDAASASESVTLVSSPVTQKMAEFWEAGLCSACSLFLPISGSPGLWPQARGGLWTGLQLFSGGGGGKLLHLCIACPSFLDERSWDSTFRLTIG